MSTLRVAIAGVGTIGAVHVKAARVAGATVVGVSGGNPERTRTTADALGVDKVFATSEELVTDPSVDVVHICTPNASHASLALLALEGGKHVICEKPLAADPEDADKVFAAAAASGRVTAVPFVYRFHPMVREARARVAKGEVGALRLLHGTYQQDWLASPDDYSWRVDPKQGGTSQAFADIGSHWCDLVEFVSGHRITRLNAKTLTTVPERSVSDGVAFSRGGEGGERIAVTGDDAITMMFETNRGAAGTLLISQVSWGRKNRLLFEMVGEHESIVFDQEDAERLWIGHRDSEITLNRDPGVLDPAAARYATLPAGHAQGYAQCFEAFVADVYATVKGGTPDGLPTFADGQRATAITRTVLESSKSESWKEVTQ